MSSPIVSTPTMSADTTSPYTANFPSYIAGDSIILCCNWTDGDGTLSITTPTGWNKRNEGHVGGNRYGIVFGKVMDGSEGSSVNITGSKSVNFTCHAFKVSKGSFFGIAITDFLECSDAYNNGVLAEPARCPNFDPSWAGAKDTVWIAYSAYSEATGVDTTATATPTNYSDLQQNTQGLGSGGNRSISSRRSLLAASEDPGDYSHVDNTGNQQSFTVAVRGAEFSGGGGPRGGGTRGGGGPNGGGNNGGPRNDKTMVMSRNRRHRGSW